MASAYPTHLSKGETAHRGSLCKRSMITAVCALVIIGWIFSVEALPSTTMSSGPSSQRPRSGQGASRSPGSCWLRITLGGDELSRDGIKCGAAPCTYIPVLSGIGEGYVQVSVGSRIARIVRRNGRSAWEETIELGCVDGNESLSMMILSDTMVEMGGCEARRVGDLISGETQLCKGLNGSEFYYMVEHNKIAASAPNKADTSMAARVLQATNTSTSSATDDPITDESDSTSTSSTDSDETPAPAPAVTDESTSTEDPPTPEPTTSVETPPPVASPTPEPTSVVVTTPEPTSAVVLPTPAPIVSTPTPVVENTGAPELTTESSVLPTTPSPTVSEVTPVPIAVDGETAAPVVTTLSPATTDEELCTDACLELSTEIDHVGAYYDPTCNGGTEKVGCNFDETSSSVLDCRRCYIDRETYSSTNDGDISDWPLCPCCVATAVGLDPVTDECVEEASATPSPTAVVESEDITENDPEFLAMGFDTGDCSASGIAVFEDEEGDVITLFQLSGYSSDAGDCTDAVDVIYGSACVTDEDFTYSWTYDTSAGTHSWSWTGNCPILESSNRRLRRKLEDDTDSTSLSNSSVLCNDDSSFAAVFSATDGLGLVYADEDAEGFSDIVSNMDSVSSSIYCDKDASEAASVLLSRGVNTVLSDSGETSSSSEGSGVDLVVVIASLVGVLVLLLCVCTCCCRQRSKKKTSHMQQSLGFESAGTNHNGGKFSTPGPHMVVSNGGNDKSLPPSTEERFPNNTYSTRHERAPSEAISFMPDRIGNNYNRRGAKEARQAAKLHNAGRPTKTVMVGNNDANSREGSGSSQHTIEGLPDQHLYSDEESGDDDDARSAATGMSGPSKYAPSGYAPSSHQGGVTHDLMSQYDASVYDAESTVQGYEPDSPMDTDSREGDFISRNVGRRNLSGREGSVADTAAMSRLGSVAENPHFDYDDSESYVPSYLSDDPSSPPESHGRQGGGHSQHSGRSSRHDVRRSGR